MKEAKHRRTFILTGTNKEGVTAYAKLKARSSLEAGLDASTVSELVTVDKIEEERDHRAKGGRKCAA